MFRFSFKILLAALVSGSACAGSAQYPDRPIRIVVPFGPGTSTDGLAREFAQALSKAIKQSVVVENRAGAEGLIGAQAASAAEPDGYTVMLSSSSLTVLDPLMRKTVSLDPVKAFNPVCGIARIGNVMNMSAALHYKSLGEILAAAKAEPGKFTFGYSSATTRLAGELFQQQTGVKFTGVSYRSTAAGLSDVAGGQVDLFFVDHFSASPFYQSGKVKPVVVAGPKRLSALPTVPSARESGIPGYEIYPWFGLFIPAKVPAAVATRLREATVQALKDPAFVAMREKAGMEEFALCEDALAKYQLAEIERWRKLIKEAGIPPQ